MIPATRPIGGHAAKLLRIRLTYLWRHGRLPALAEPRLFNELIQDRKLRSRDVRLPALADKVRVKAFVVERVGHEWVIPTLWHGPVLPAQPQWQRPFVVKARHGCNQNAYVRTGEEDWQAIRRKSARWAGKTYGYWLDEWLYRHVPRGLLVEPFVGVGFELPMDYKFFVFAGRVEFIQVHLGRERRHRWIVFDRRWRRVSALTADADPQRPASLRRMIEAAEGLGRDFDFVRIDLYEVQGRPLFGEMTFYPGSGLDRFNPVSLDQMMGDHWLRARSANLGASKSDAPLNSHAERERSCPRLVEPEGPSP